MVSLKVLNPQFVVSTEGIKLNNISVVAYARFLTSLKMTMIYDFYRFISYSYLIIVLLDTLVIAKPVCHHTSRFFLVKVHLPKDF